MDRLRNENAALLRRLEELEAAGVRVGQSDGEAGVESSKEHLVPRESWEKEHKERCDLEEAVKQKEKRLLRLQQACFRRHAFPRVTFQLIPYLSLPPSPGVQQQSPRIPRHHVLHPRVQSSLFLQRPS